MKGSRSATPGPWSGIRSAGRGGGASIMKSPAAVAPISSRLPHPGYGPSIPPLREIHR